MVESRSGEYSAIAQYLQPFLPSWLPVDDALRVAAYQFYDTIYWNDYGDFQLTIRGDEQYPIYIPSARRIVKTFSRYVARDAALAVDAENDSERELAKTAFKDLFDREAFWTKFQTQKRKGITRGDWVLMLSGDPEKPEGRRISIHPVHPGTYFVLTNPENYLERWGAAIMEMLRIGDKDYIKVQRWLKPNHPDHPAFGNPEAEIAYERVIYETENFTDPTKRRTFRVDVPLDLLPGILAVPLYHFRGGGETDSVYGTSDLKGLERIFLAINQTATDQDLALAMAGLGLFVADASPVDNEGNISDWIVGPKRVIEVPTGGKFERVSGVQSVEPTVKHMEWIQRQAESVLGINAVALGDLENVGVAESGVALALRMSPLIDEATDREAEITDVTNQLLFDLKTFLSVYENINLPTTDVRIVYGPKLPVDKKGEIERLNQMLEIKAISLEWYWQQLIDLGYDINPEAMRAQMEDDAALADPTGARLAEEADAPIEGTDGE